MSGGTVRPDQGWSFFEGLCMSGKKVSVPITGVDNHVGGALVDVGLKGRVTIFRHGEFMGLRLEEQEKGSGVLKECRVNGVPVSETSPLIRFRRNQSVELRVNGFLPLRLTFSGQAVRMR